MIKRARGRTKRTPGVMNGLEKSYSQLLEMQRRSGEIVSWQFEAMNLRLAPKCFYKPDFLVITKEGFVEFHETKGHFESAAKVRMKVVAEKFPFFVFRLVKKTKRVGGFSIEVFGPAL